MNKFNPDQHLKIESPLIYHVYNDKRIKAFKITYHSFIKFIMYQQLNASNVNQNWWNCTWCFYWYNYFEGKTKAPKCNKDFIGGIIETTIKDFTKCINTTPRAPKYIEEYHKPIKHKQI